MIAVIRKHHYS